MNLNDVLEELIKIEPITHWEPEKDGKELGFYYYSIQDIEIIISNLKVAIKEDSQPLTREWLEQWEIKRVQLSCGTSYPIFENWDISVTIHINDVLDELDAKKIEGNDYINVCLKKNALVVLQRLNPTIGQFKELCKGLGVKLNKINPN